MSVSIDDLRLDAIASLVDACDSPGFFFVNIGANDGVANDPIFPFARERGWKGLAVEPDPDVFEQLRHNCRDLAGIAFERAAITARPGPLYRMAPGPFERAHWMSQISCASKHRLLEVIRGIRAYAPFGDVPSDLERYVERVDVPCFTFDELVTRHGIERIDYLNIDVEGTDLELLAAIDLERFHNRLCASRWIRKRIPERPRRSHASSSAATKRIQG